MAQWVSVASAAAPAGLAAFLSLRTVNRGSARRFRAAFIDLAIAGALFALVWGGVGMLLGASGVPGLALEVDFAWVLGVVLAGMFLLLRDDLPLQASSSRSPGKAHQHIRLQRRDGSPMNPLTSVLRNLTLLALPLLWLDWAAPLAAAVLLVEVVLIWRDRSGRRLGDRLAGTRILFRRHHAPTPDGF